MSKYYTGIGSRETPKDIMQLMTDAAHKLVDKGYILRSGGAQGADSAFEQGCLDWWKDSDHDWPPTIAQIYIPWASFASPPAEFKDWYVVLDRTQKAQEAYAIAESVHPAWSVCSRGAKALHARNVYQVLGHGLDKPSRFLICWAKENKHGNIQGGTATAWNLATKYLKPERMFNLFREEDKQRLIKFVES